MRAAKSVPFVLKPRAAPTRPSRAPVGTTPSREARIVTALDLFDHVTVLEQGTFGRMREISGIITGFRWDHIEIRQPMRSKTLTIRTPIERIRELRQEAPSAPDEIARLGQSTREAQIERDRVHKLRTYARFLERDVWEDVKPTAVADLALFREGCRTPEHRRIHLETLAADIEALIHAQYGTSRIGYHYNLHGGFPESYMMHGGIHASVGDIALRFGASGRTAHSIYHFSSPAHSLYTVLSERHGEHLLWKVRMGTVLILFNLAHPMIRDAVEVGGLTLYSDICLDLKEPSMAPNPLYPRVGVPNEAFLVPPLAVFLHTAKRLGVGRLTWDEETLVTLRYLERALLDPAPALT